MLAQAYEGYFENGRFFAAGQTVRIPEKKRVFITVIDESIRPDEDNILSEIEHLSREVKVKEEELRAAWIRRLETASDLSMDEELPDIQRSTFLREPVILTDEG